jgi:hypothetical protein
MKTGNRDQRSGISASASGGFEETLRLVARLSAPEGLEERVHAGLLAAKSKDPHKARILRWPAAPRMENAWMQSSLARSAAAAAIVCAVVGGGWLVTSRIQPAQPTRAITIPPPVSAPGGFNSAGAMRTPQTLNGPVVALPAAAKPQPTELLPTKPAAKATTHSALAPRHRGKDARKAIVPPVAPAPSPRD